MISEQGVKKDKLVHFLTPLYFCFLAVFVLALFAWPSRLSSSDLHPQFIDYKIGFITDIHASNQSVRAMNPSNTIYPNKYQTLLPEALKKMKLEEIKLVVNLGDFTNNNSIKRAKEIKKMLDEEKMEGLWAKGNHDDEEIMQALDLFEYYYFIDKYNWRIVVLNSSEGLDGKESIPGYNTYNGGIGKTQLDWLKKTLGTEKDVVIAMHHPIWDKETISYINPNYQDFKNIIEESRRVRYVFSGHWHTPYWEKELNGIKYFGITAFSLEGQEGFYKTVSLPCYYYSSYEPV